MIVTNNNKNLPNYIVSIITCSCCRFRSNWSNCEWDFYDPIQTIEKYALAHVFITVFFVIKLSTFGALCFHFPTRAEYVSPYIGFETTKKYKEICKS